MCIFSSGFNHSLPPLLSSPLPLPASPPLRIDVGVTGHRSQCEAPNPPPAFGTLGSGDRVRSVAARSSPCRGCAGSAKGSNAVGKKNHAHYGCSCVYNGEDTYIVSFLGFPEFLGFLRVPEGIHTSVWNMTKATQPRHVRVRNM